MKLPDSVYNKLKWLVIIVIPSLTTFYAVLDGDSSPIKNMYMNAVRL